MEARAFFARMRQILVPEDGNVAMVRFLAESDRTAPVPGVLLHGTGFGGAHLYFDSELWQPTDGVQVEAVGVQGISRVTGRRFSGEETEVEESCRWLAPAPDSPCVWPSTPLETVGDIWMNAPSPD